MSIDLSSSEAELLAEQMRMEHPDETAEQWALRFMFPDMTDQERAYLLSVWSTERRPNQALH